METPLIIAVATGVGVFFLCILILIGYMCYRRFKKEPEYTDDEESQPDIQVDNVQTPNVIMTRKDRTEDLFTGKRTPFGVHNSISSIPDAIDKEEHQMNHGYEDDHHQQNGIKPRYQSNKLSVRSAHSVHSVRSVHSTTSNAPSFSEYAGGVNSSIHY